MQVRFPKLVTSYATPPQSEFSCAPCSVYRKAETSSKRWTYLSANKPKKQIQCFVEDSSATLASTGQQEEQSAPDNSLNISKRTFSLKNSEASVVSLGAIFSGKVADDESFDIVAIQGDGKVRRLSSELDIERWSVDASSPQDLVDKSAQSGKLETISGFFISFDDARKSLFKRRHDLLATVMSQGQLSTILVLVQKPSTATELLPNDVYISFFSIPADHSTPAMGLKHLTTIRPPTPAELKKRLPCSEMQWEISASTGHLTLSYPNGVINYDLSAYAPNVSSQLTFADNDAKLTSALSLSPQILMGVRSESSVALYNTRYQSSQAEIPMDVVQSAAVPDKSRKNVIGGLRLVSFFSKLSLVIGVYGNSLLAFDIGPSSLEQITGSHKRTHEGLLIHAIGRGLNSAKTVPPSSIDQAMLEKLLKGKGLEQWTQNSIKGPGTLIQTLVDSKPSLRYLLQLLRSSVDLPPAELVHGMRIVLDIARRYSQNPDSSLPETPKKGELSIPTPSKQLSKPENPSVSKTSSYSGAEALLINAVACFNLTLARLQMLPRSVVTSDIRAILSNSDTLAIIHHLRHALVMGGHTASFSSSSSNGLPHGEEVARSQSGKIPTLSLSTIVDMLIVCVDAVGPGGWISAAAFAGDSDTSDKVEASTLIAEVKSEVAAALAGVGEAVQLKGLLREMLRVGESTSSDSNSTAADGVLQGKTKVSKSTGEIRNRSTREIGYMKRRAVGKYSFERLEV